MKGSNVKRVLIAGGRDMFGNFLIYRVNFGKHDVDGLPGRQRLEIMLNLNHSGS
jgi:hypothetical protein